MMVKKEKWSVKAVAFILGVILCCNPFSALAEEKTATLDDIDYSAVYDYDYYIARYPDVVSVLGTDPKIVLKHFVTYGMSEGRRGNSSFDVWSYRNKYPDLRQAFGNDLPSYYLHYIRYGKAEKRVTTGVGVLQDPLTVLNGTDYSPIYNYQYYITNHPDCCCLSGRRCRCSDPLCGAGNGGGSSGM